MTWTAVSQAVVQTDLVVEIDLIDDELVGDRSDVFIGDALGHPHSGGA